MLFLVLFFMFPLYGMQKQFVSHEAVIIVVQEAHPQDQRGKPPIKKYKNKEAPLNNPIERPNCCERMPLKVKLGLIGLATSVVAGIVTLIIHFTGK